MNYIEFIVLKAFTSEFKLRTNHVKAFNCFNAKRVCGSRQQLFQYIGRACGATVGWFRDGLLENLMEGGGAGEVQKKIRAREN